MPMNPIVEHARDLLEGAGLEVSEVRELPTGLGWQLRCAGGEMVCAYRTGKLVAQGRNAAMVAGLLQKAPPAPKPAAPPRPARPPSPPAPAQPDTASDRTAPARLPAGWTTAPWDGISLPWSTDDPPCVS